MTTESLEHKLLKLVSDEDFIAYKALTSRPNLLRIAGRTFTETWHSMILAWILDPAGSHGLGDFALRRLLNALVNARLTPGGYDKVSLARYAALAVFDGADVTPNERDQKEYSIPGRCGKNNRVDILIPGIQDQDGYECVVLIEMKVGAAVDKAQCVKYADWMEQNYPAHLRLPVMIAPDERLGISSSSSLGDDRWFALDHQQLYDEVLAPVERAVTLNPNTAPLVSYYVDALRTPLSGRKLAVTEEERDLAMRLFEKHEDAFRAIESAIKREVDYDLSQPEKLPLRAVVNGVELTGSTVPEFYASVLEYVHQNLAAYAAHIPYATGSKRYLVATSPLHPTDKPFLSQVGRNGLYMEAHKSRLAAVDDAKRFLAMGGFEVI